MCFCSLLIHSYFSLLSGGTCPPDDYDSDETIWKQGTTPIELPAPLPLAAPAVVTLQKFVALPEFGDESHQFAEPPPRMILIQNATAVLLFQFIKPALIRLHPRFYVSFLIDEIPGPFFQDRITDWKNFA